MKKFGSKTYPDTMAGVLQDRALLKLLTAFSEKEYSRENIDFLTAPFEPEELYNEFLSTEAKREVNVGTPIRRKVAEMVAIGNWKHPDWVEVIEAAREEIMLLVESDTLGRFWRSPLFRAYHVKNGGDASDVEETITDPPPRAGFEGAAIELDIKDSETLRKYIAALEKHGETATLGVAAKLLRSEGKKMNAYIFNRLLIARGYAKKPPTPATVAVPVEPEEAEPNPAEVILKVELDKKKMQECGFSDVSKPEIQELLKDVIYHWEQRQNQKAIQSYEKILKKQPSKSAIQTIPLVDLMKLLKKKKAYALQSMEV